MTIRGHKLSIGTFTSKKATTAYGALAFLYTINNNSFYGSPNTLSATNMSLAGKAQAFFVGIPFYRITGSPILCTGIPNGVPPAISPSFNISKATNKIFWAGVALSVYGALGMHFKLPYAGPAWRVGINIAGGAFIGGGFDPDPPGAAPTSGIGSYSTITMSQAPGAGLPAQGSFTDAVRA